MFLEYLDKFYFPFIIDHHLYGLKVFTPIFMLLFWLLILMYLVSLVVSHYDLQQDQKDHNEHKRNHFLFHVLSLVLVSKPQNSAICVF